MNQSGKILLKFPVNRPLTPEERELRFDPQIPQIEGANDWFTIIRYNSTYLEVVDRYHATRGFITFIALLFAFMGLSFSAAMTFSLAKHNVLTHESLIVKGEIYPIAGNFLLIALFYAKSIWLFSRECFNFTHSSIRFNRKNRLVYRHRDDGGITIVPWDELFVTMGYLKGRITQFWDLRCHVLAEDKDTVLETFALGGSDLVERRTKQYWEFIRRYMDEGPESLPPVFRCLPVTEKRESLAFCYYRWASQSDSILFNIAMLPLHVAFTLSRWLSDRLGRIPSWPPEVEAACIIAPHDPYIRDASQDPPVTWASSFNEVEHLSGSFKHLLKLFYTGRREALPKLKTLFENTKDQAKRATIQELIDDAEAVLKEEAELARSQEV